MKKSKYHIEVDSLVEDGIDTNGQPSYKIIKVWVDCYMIQDSLNQNPRPAHSFKKLWALGQRSGGKSYSQDLKEAIWSLQNELDLQNEQS